jgi:hypothetical protein
MARIHFKLRRPLLAAFARPRLRRRGEGGFTFVEAIVATAILTGGMVAVAQLLVLSLQMHHMGRSTSTGSKLATAKVEELMKLNFDTAPAIAITPVSPDALGQNVTGYNDSPGGGYTRRWKVEAGPAADTRRLTLRVIPPAVNLNVYRTVEVVTILRRW